MLLAVWINVTNNLRKNQRVSKHARMQKQPNRIFTTCKYELWDKNHIKFRSSTHIQMICRQLQMSEN